jgi:hypothetical protein
MLGFQKNTKWQLEEYLIFCYALLSALLDHFAFKEVLGPIGTPAVREMASTLISATAKVLQYTFHKVICREEKKIFVLL